MKKNLVAELLGDEGGELLLDKVEARPHRVRGVDQNAEVAFGQGAEEFAGAAAQPGESLLVEGEGGVEPLLVASVQVGRDVHVDDWAVVPEDVRELIAVAGVDELFARYLKAHIQINLCPTVMFGKILTPLYF